MTDPYTAGPQTLGYLYQLRYALLRGLTAPEDVRIHLEQLDDVTLEVAGSPAELLSLKHQCRQASLTNACGDLWKTLRIWATRLSDAAISPSETRLSLVSTATASEGSAAAYLRPGAGRDTDRALSLLENTAQTSKNEDLKKAFEAFLALDSAQRELLVGMIEVLDRRPDIVDTRDHIGVVLAHATRREHRGRLLDRLEGWWFDRCVRILRGASPIVPVFELHDQVRSIAEQFHPEALPIDFSAAMPPTAPDPDADTRRFVIQLRLIGLSAARVEKAVIDYYRAFEQRSRWAREDLLIGDEVANYERKLVDEWDRFRLAITEELEPELSESALRQVGREIFNWMEQRADFRIRPNVSEDYVRRGSYHLLADADPARVWWHPRFFELVVSLFVKEGVA